MAGETKSLKFSDGAEVDSPAASSHEVTTLTMTEQASTPASSPGPGKKMIYPKSDGNLYMLDDEGNEFKVGTASPDSGDFVTADGTQTLTNKTLTAPKLNEAVALTATATELNQLDGVTVGGTASGDITTTDGTQTLENKTLDAAKIGGASNDGTDGFLDFQDQSADVATPGSGSDNVRLFAKDKKLYTATDDGSGAAVIQEVGSGAGGSGDKNYASNPSAANDTTGWVTSGLTLTRETTAANLPRSNTTGTGFKGVSSTDGGYAEWQFTLDAADQVAANLVYELAAKVADSGVWKLEIYEYPDNTFTDADKVEIPLTSDDSNDDTFLPASTATFRTYWTPKTKAYIGARIVHVGTSSNTIYWSDTLLGPGTAAQGAYIGPWTDFPDGTFALVGSSNESEFTNYQINSAKYYPVGENLHAEVEVGFTGTPGTGAGNFALVFKTGSDFTVDTKGATSGRTIRGTARYQISAATPTVDSKFASYSSTQQGGIFTDISSTALGTVASGDKLFLTFEVPIAEWKGKGVVNLLTDAQTYKNARFSAYSISEAVLNNTLVPFGTLDFNEGGGAFSAGLYTVPVDGYYEVSFGINIASGTSLTRQWDLELDATKVASTTGDQKYMISFAPKVFYATKGQTFGVRNSTGNCTTTANSGDAYISITRVADYSAGDATGHWQATADTYGLVRKNKWQEKTISSNLTTTTDPLTALGFSNLTIGRTYKLSGKMYVQLSGTTTNEYARLKWTHDGNIILNLEAQADTAASTSDQTVMTPEKSIVFVATATTIVATLIISGTATVASGSANTGARLEELANYEETDEW